VNEAKYIGMDVHQATISVAVMDSSGKLILESILETKDSTSISKWDIALRPRPFRLDAGGDLTAIESRRLRSHSP
jgi:hypothetical protein